MPACRNWWKRRVFFLPSSVCIAESGSRNTRTLYGLGVEARHGMSAKSWRSPASTGPTDAEDEKHQVLCFRLSPALVRELAVLGYGLIALYTCVFGSLLAIFVPQLCDAPSVVMGRNGTAAMATARVECTLEQNVYIEIDAVNAVALFFNFLTCALLLGGFIFEFYRERFICMHFDIDYSKPEGFLDSDLMTHDSLRRELIAWNKRYHDIFVVIIAVASINVVVSGVLVFSAQWFQGALEALPASRKREPPSNAPTSIPTASRTLGYRGATTFTTNVIFLATRLANTIYLSQTSSGVVRATSVNLAEPLQFNIIAASARHSQMANSIPTQNTQRSISRRHLDVLGLPASYPSRYGHGSGV